MTSKIYESKIFEDMRTMDDLHRKVLRKFHTLCSVAGMTAEEKLALVGSYGVESSADIDTHELIDICYSLDRQINGDIDRLRKRVMAAIGGWLRMTGREGNAELIKGIACNATGYGSFNRIPKERLCNLYNAFRNKAKDMEGVETVVGQVLQTGMVRRYNS